MRSVSKLGQPRQPRTASGNAQAAAANCSADKAGISDLAINRIEEIVRPTDAQGDALDRLDAAMQKGIERLRQACPNTTPQTPVGRLDVMQKRVEAMIDAATTLRPALEEFYASLNDEQKAKFNRSGASTRSTAASVSARHFSLMQRGRHGPPPFLRSVGNATFPADIFPRVSGPRHVARVF